MAGSRGNARGSDRGDDKGATAQLRELRELVVAYAKQETVEPVKRLGRFLAYGTAGAALAGIGVVLLSLAGLRALQTETGGTFDGNWSWVPYGLALLASGTVTALAGRAVASPRRRGDHARRGR